MHVIVPTEANVDGQRAANRKKKLRDALVYFNIKTDNPVSKVVNDQFKQILNLLISKFIIPCRQTITNRLIPEKFLNRFRLCKEISYKLLCKRYIRIKYKKHV